MNDYLSHAQVNKIKNSQWVRAGLSSRSRMQDGGPQNADDGAVESGELPARQRPTPGRSRMKDGGQQSADDGVVESGELTLYAPHPAGAGCLTAACRVQMMELSKPASSLRSESSELPAGRRPTPGRSRMPDGGPQSADDGIVESGELSSLREPTPGWSRMPDGGPQSADDGVVEASELP